MNANTHDTTLTLQLIKCICIHASVRIYFWLSDLFVCCIVYCVHCVHCVSNVYIRAKRLFCSVHRNTVDYCMYKEVYGIFRSNNWKKSTMREPSACDTLHRAQTFTFIMHKFLHAYTVYKVTSIMPCLVMHAWYLIMI